VITCHVRYEIVPEQLDRERFGVDPDFVDADRIRDESGCVRRYERSFLRPLLP
jgi:hypothetical protein